MKQLTCMKLLFLIVFINVISSAVAQTDTLKLKMNAKAGMDSIQSSFKRGDLDLFTNLMHPELIKLSGGVAAFKNLLKKQMSSLKEASIDSLAVGDVIQLLRYKNQWQCVIISFMQLTVDSITVTTSSSNIGVSYNNGVSWKFIRVSDGNETKIMKLFPSLSSQLKIPVNKSARGTMDKFVRSFQIEYASE